MGIIQHRALRIGQKGFLVNSQPTIEDLINAANEEPASVPNVVTILRVVRELETLAMQYKGRFTVLAVGQGCAVFPKGLNAREFRSMADQHFKANRLPFRTSQIGNEVRITWEQASRGVRS